MYRIIYDKVLHKSIVHMLSSFRGVIKVKKSIMLLLVIMISLSLISCIKETVPPSTIEVPTTEAPDLSTAMMSDMAKEYGITDENYPKIDGSTSTLSIVRAINRAMYDNGSNRNYPETASKTVPSYNLLINGEVDMIIVPYASSDVLELAESKGVKLEFYPIASEALVFITPKENEAENITREQVRKIYLDYGIKDWSELGGPNRELVPICRNADSGSQSQMDNLILEGSKMHSDIQKNYVELTMEGMLELVAFYHNGGLDGKPSDSYALGYTLYTYLKNMGEITGIDERLKILSFEGVAPTEESIIDGTYSLTDAYYVVVRSDLPQEHSARNIIKWLESDEGKTEIRSLGLIPKDLKATSNSTNYEKVNVYMEEESRKAFSPYYELLSFEISDYQEDIVNGNVEAVFFYKLIHKNYDKDPDTVGYIKEAKERGNKNYQQLYDEYLQPKEMNFQLKAVIDGNDSITLYSNDDPKGIKWEKVKMSDYILNNNVN